MPSAARGTCLLTYLVMPASADTALRAITPIIEAAITKGALVHTDEYGIYARLPTWGDRHKAVRYGYGKYARDEDGDGFCAVHEHDQRLLVAAALRVTPEPEHLAGEAGEHAPR